MAISIRGWMQLCEERRWNPRRAHGDFWKLLCSIYIGYISLYSFYFSLHVSITFYKYVYV